MSTPQGTLDLERLRKVLELERSKGYADTAVTGGLDKLLARFESEHPGKLRLPSPSYRALNARERERWIAGVLGLTPPPSKRPASAPAPPKPQRLPKPAIALDAPLTAVRGINTKSLPKFHKLGLGTVRDLLYFFPRRHIDYSSPTPIADLEPGTEQTVLVQIWQTTNKKTKRGMSVTEVTVGDSTGTMKAIFFNQPFLAEKFTPSARVILSGRLSIFKGNRVFQPTSYEMADEEALKSGQIIPVYPLTEGLYPRYLRRVIKGTLDSILPSLPDFIPEEVRKSAQLIGLAEAIRQAHYPEDEISKFSSRRRLAFDELFLIQIGVLAKRRERQEGTRGINLNAPPEHVRRFVDSLPFKLTSAQRRALDESLADLKRERPMSRLLHGDVGSGKTVVATAAMLHAVASGAQAALMVPTEILAEQHFRNISRLLGAQESGDIVCSADSVLGRPVSVGLLTGSVRQKGKKELYRQIGAGEVDIAIGTQALIQEKVEFKELGLVVVDEQHRFG
ncbi:MAG: DEAD/DEAH box helicase, partial [Chloroflexi bacterium]|nr:DEAD/DEAH box helicase [Chloroflexota bacterium]